MPLDLPELLQYVIIRRVAGCDLSRDDARYGLPYLGGTGYAMLI